ncbi:hypothetical protein D3C80_1598440 [compost metagenome]
MHLGAEHLLLQVALLGFTDDGLHQLVANLQSAPILEYRHAADLAIGKEAGGADGEITFVGQEMHGVQVVGIPFQLGRYRLLGDEHGLANTANLAVVLLPVRYTHLNVIHRQTPGFLV